MTEYFLRLEPAEQAVPLSPETIAQELNARGLEPRSAMRTDRGWFVQARTTGGTSPGAPPFPAAWKIAEEHPVLDQISWPGAGGLRAVGEIFTFALLLWPAVVGLFLLADEGWQLALKVALIVWLGTMHLVAYRQERGAFFGNSMLMLSGCVAAFWWTHPGPWMYAWLAVVLIGIYAAVRGVLRHRVVPGVVARESVSTEGNG